MDGSKGAVSRVIARAKENARSDSGYSLVELLSVLVIMGVVSATVTAGVALGMRTMISVGGVSVSESVAANAVSDMVENITLANPILSMSRDRIVLLRDLPGRCERHEYVVVYVTPSAALENAPNITPTPEPRRLQHIIERYPLAPGTDCASLAVSVWGKNPASPTPSPSGTGTPTSAPGQNRILNTPIIENLVPNPPRNPSESTPQPIFSFAGPGGRPILLPGDTGYSPAGKQYGPCEVSRITITLSVKPATEDMVQTIQSAASPRAYSLGLRCQ